MRALVFRGPWDLAVEERPDPVAGPGEVVVGVVSTGICGSDLHGYTGENGRRFPGQVMGHETVGRVVAVGPDVPGSARLAEGALVTVHPVLACGSCDACRSGQDHHCPTRQIIGVAPAISAAFAELMVVPAANVIAMPEDMPAEYGALVEPLAVGYHAMTRGRCGPDDNVLVVGGGPIGQACALAARRLGAGRVTVSEPHPGRRALLADIGLTAVDPAAAPLADTLAETGVAGPSLVVDAVGSSRSLGDALAVAAEGERVVLVGMHEPQVSLAAYAVSIAERSIVGSYCYSREDFASTAAWVADGPAELARLVEGRVSLADAPSAFRALAEGKDGSSKVLVFPAGVTG
ncbi:alcohol dehydrogenase catalytic domain-containing protein [Actinopolymorpha rutila]|uniref:Threonine dehydrogenase-like Zn-dependent dehydrogenase n=1 Tax=Actinopolymorpha rutila TaxID=446787 RepID=A0A852ZHC3_9ACTN|nr:threonine dehydrogenase-like Zn-dependent dehydrogenase [Actinopolymorpha rutila]